MAHLVPRDMELSRRRAPCREAVLFFLAAVGEATLWEVSEATGIRPARVMAIMRGAREAYAADLSLVAQGVVVQVPDRHAPRFRITEAGRRCVRRAAEAPGLAWA